jgi:hypothetical protein
MGYTSRERKLVCLLGRGSDALKNAFAYRNLRLENTSLEEALRQCSAAAKAIIIVRNPLELSKILAAALRRALENGVAFVAIDTDRSGRAQVQQMCGPGDISNRLGISTDDAARLPVRAFRDDPHWEEVVAQHVAEHIPGSSAGLDYKENADLPSAPHAKFPCVVEHAGLDGASSPDSEDIVLIQRAFHDCSKVELTYLAGGQSGSHGPWRVDAEMPDGQSPVKFVVKTGRIGEISGEISIMRDPCFNRIPFRHYPPVASNRCVIGATKRAIVSMLVEDVTVFEEYILENSPSDAILQMFAGPLSLWRKVGNVGTVPVGIGEEYRARHVIPPNPSELEEIWGEARKGDEDVLSPEQIYARLISHPKVDVYIVHSHGDLHLRNILIHETGEVLLIDFSRSAAAPASYDPSTLDVSLAFDIPKHLVLGAGITDTRRLELYTPPLLREYPFGKASHRTAAILTLRNMVRELVSEAEYELAVAGWLIWHAKNRKSQIAYRCASRILADLGQGTP